MQIDNDLMCLNYSSDFRWLVTPFSRTLDRKLRFGHWAVVFHVILIEGGLFKGGKTSADLKCEGKEASESEKLTIDVINVTRISRKSVTKLVGVGSK